MQFQREHSVSYDERRNKTIINMEKIPAEMKEQGRFCCWRLEERGGRPTKVPYDPRTGAHARSNDPDSFADFETALTAAQRGGFSGIGAGLFDGVCAIDIDHCKDAKTGEPTDMAKDIIRTMHSYTEVSPSGSGYHIFFRADGFPFDAKRYYIMRHEFGLEVYIAGATSKYVTLTGDRRGGDQGFGDRSAELQQVLDKYMLREPACTEPKEESSMKPDDDALLALAMSSRSGEAFRRLWEGDISGYSSHSEADMALCSRLAFWTAKDAAQMDRLFRRSGLMREKWERSQSGSTYGRITIENAISACQEMYTWRTEPPVASLREEESTGFRPFRPLELAEEQLPPFPVDALPKPIADYVTCVAISTQTAPDMAATVALGVMAIAVQGKYELMVNPSWREQLCLLTAVIASPGERKSPVVKLMTRCIEDYEHQNYLRLEPMIRQRRQEKEAIQRRIAGLRREL